MEALKVVGRIEKRVQAMVHLDSIAVDSYNYS